MSRQNSRDRAIDIRSKCAPPSRRCFAQQKYPRPLPARSRRTRSLLRNRADGGDRARVLDLPDAGGDQIFLDRLLVNLLQQSRDLGFVGIDNLLQDFLRVLVARLHAFEIEDSEAAEFAHGDGELHIDHAIHGAGEDRDLELERLPFLRGRRQVVSTSLGLIVTRPGTSAISSKP